MKKLILFFLSLTLSEVSYAQFNIGIRDNKFANAGYEWNTGWGIRLEHSIFDESLKYQYIRGYGLYEKQLKNFSIELSTYFGTTYCNSFYDCGATVNLAYQPLKWFGIKAGLNPKYDSDYKYETCYLIGTFFPVTNEIILVAQYSTSPEYRISEKRFKLGLNIAIKRLMISPAVSFPIKNDTPNLRVLIGFKYFFRSKK